MPIKAKRLKVLTLGEVADVYAVTIDTVKRWRSAGMPGKPKAYELHAITNWLRTEGPWKRWDKPDDPLLVEEADSPGLERYRLAKAQHAELDLAQRMGELIDRELAKSVLGRWAVVIRRMGDNLAKRFGNDAALAVNEALKECEVIVEGLDNDTA